MNPYYYSADDYFKQTFGKKMYRLSLDGGMTCPNRDGTLSAKGCSFCSALGSGDFAERKSTSVADQIESAKRQVAKKLPKNGAPFGYLAYFQSFTNTYAPVETLRTLFYEAIRHPDIEALFIATRPDCLPEPVLDLLSELKKIKPVYIELGFQTSKEESIRYINRGYPNSVFETAVKKLAARDIPVIVHCILGLPYESIEDMKQTITDVCALPIHGIKLQLLHVLHGTTLAEDFEELKAKHAFACMELTSYIDTVLTLLPLIPKHIVIYRLTGDGPKRLLIAPLFSADKKRVLNELMKQMKLRNITQGEYSCNPNR
ncbi:MAG: TIGR01212 family radical SAM protein [Lachnospiraceae bacterium]